MSYIFSKNIQPTGGFTASINYHLEKENVYALDFPAAIDTPIYSPVSGQMSHYVTRSVGNIGGVPTVPKSTEPWAGIYAIKILGDDGKTYLFCHLKQNTLDSHDTPKRIKQGELIGRVGNRGHSDGPHLHFSVLKNGENLGYGGEYKFSTPYNESETIKWFNLYGHSTGINSNIGSTGHQTPITHPTTTNHSTPCQIKYSTDIHVKAIYKLHTYADNKCTVRNSYLIPELTQFWMIQDSNTGNYLVYTNNLPYFNQPVFLKHQVMTEQDVIATPDYGTK